MKTLYSLFVCLLLSCISLKGQNEAPTPFRDLIPSPNSCALAQYAEFPVSLYTGTPTISIPLYTIDLGTYQLPISLSYHASGIRVAQEASWVGLGWTLNAGGAIMRTIRGKDDLFDGYFSNKEEMPMTPSEIENSSYYTVLAKNPQNNLFSFRLNRDTEPDIFYYNFDGYSGRFYCKCGGDVLQAQKAGSGFICEKPEDNLRIEEIYRKNTFLGMKITTANGIAYCFTQPEIKKTEVNTKENADMASNNGPFPFNNSSFNIKHETAWYLKDIYYPNGEHITFTYDKEIDAYLSPTSVSQYIYHVIEQKGQLPPPYFFSPKGIYSTDLTVEYPRLKSIRWKTGRIQFTASAAERKDVCSLASYQHVFTTSERKPHALYQIQIYGITGKKEQLLKTYTFHESYFTSSEPCEDYLGLRLKLDSITLKGKAERQRMYKMEYDTRYPLPSKNSFSCDYWGYYNGKANTCLYPSVLTKQDYTGLTGQVIIPKGKFYTGADRTASPVVATSSMLTALETPEGGRTEFTFKSNEIENGEIITFPLSDKGEFRGDAHFVKSDKELYHGFRFTMPCDGYIDFIYSYYGNKFHAEKEQMPVLQVGNYAFNAQDIDEWDNRTMCRSHLLMKKGTYTLVMMSSLQGIGAEITMKFYEVPYYKGPPATCGIHLSQVKSPVSTKIYIYKEGLLLRELLHTVRETYFFTGGNGVSNWKPSDMTGMSIMLKQSSMSINPMESQTAGVLFGYGNVQVLTETSEGNLREDFYYYNRKEASPVAPGLPGEFVFTNGKLKRHCVFRENQLVKSSYLDYSEDQIYSLKCLRENESNTFLISPYTIPIHFCAPYKQNDSIIDIEGNESFVHYQLNTYRYNMENHQLQRIKTVENNLNRIQEIYYTTDFKDRSPYKEMCEEANMVCTPIEKNFYKGTSNSLVKKVLYTYMRNKQNNQFVPEAEFTYYHPKGNAEPIPPYGDFKLYKKADLRYAGYDSISNCTSLKSDMGQSAVYIWGYRRRYPVAQIFNATLEEVKAQGIDIEAIGRNEEPTEAQWQILHALRGKLPKAEIYIMTYEPEVGITSKTDGRGMTTYYEYDDMGQLNCIRDNDRNIIQTNHLKLATEK